MASGESSWISDVHSESELRFAIYLDIKKYYLFRIALFFDSGKNLTLTKIMSISILIASSFTSTTSTCSTTSTLFFFITENRDEHTLDLIIGWYLTLEYHITKVDRFFFDGERWIFCYSEFELICTIISRFNLDRIIKSEFYKSLIYKSFE